MNQTITISEELRFSNPIDAYFLPKIDEASSAAEIKDLQTTYRGVWKLEFDNIIRWLEARYVYDEDNETVAEYARSVEKMIDAACEIKILDLFTPEEREQNQLELGHRGNPRIGVGYAGFISFAKGIMYRDAGMQAINDDYSFLEQDYSIIHYE